MEGEMSIDFCCTVTQKVAYRVWPFGRHFYITIIYLQNRPMRLVWRSRVAADCRRTLSSAHGRLYCRQLVALPRSNDVTAPSFIRRYVA